MRDWGIDRPPAWHAAGVTDTGRMRRERDLVTYYDNEVHDRAGRELPAERVGAADEKVRAALVRHGAVERWKTWESASDLHYQFAVVRTP
jgi:hypothetical protein